MLNRISKNQIILLCIILIVLGGFILWITKTSKQTQLVENHTLNTTAIHHATIDQLTTEAKVSEYIKQHNRLPDYYITKRQAQQQGWRANEGNLCEVLPNRAIGGDRFFNRENQLPVKPKRIWFEADINYHCGHRDAGRLIYSNDGLIFATYDHYRTFKQLY